MALTVISSFAFLLTAVRADAPALRTDLPRRLPAPVATPGPKSQFYPVQQTQYTNGFSQAAPAPIDAPQLRAVPPTASWRSEAPLNFGMQRQIVGSVEQIPVGADDVLPEPIVIDQLRLDVMLRAARNAVGLKDIALAISRFEELFDEFPTHVDSKVEYVGLLVQSGELTKAQTQLEQLMQARPNRLDYYALYSDILIGQGKFLNAEYSLQKLVESGQADTQTIVTYARVLAWQGKLDEANKIYQDRLSMLSMLPQTTEIHVAGLLMELKRPMEAAVLLARLHESDPANADLLAKLVLCNARLGQEANVFEYLESLRQNPFLSQYQRLELADTLYRENRFQIALQLYQSAIEKAPSDFIVQAKIVRCHVRLFDIPAAKAMLDAMSARSSDHVVRLETANYHTVMGEHATAYAIYRALLTEHPKDPLVLKGLGVLYLSIGDYRAAETVFRQGMSIEASDADMRHLLAESLLKQLRITEATQVLEPPINTLGASSYGIVMGADPSANASTIADVLIRAKDYGTAEAICNAALKTIRDTQGIIALRTSLGFAQLKQGRNSEALDTFQQTRQMPGGNSPELRYGLYCCLVNLDRQSDADALLAEELRAFGPATRDRVIIAQLAIEDCNCVLAERLLQQAIMFDPSNDYIKIVLAEAQGMCNRCLGGCDDRSQYLSALANSPSNTRAQLGLARSYARTNQLKESSRYYNKILTAFPQHELARIENARVMYAWKGTDHANGLYSEAVTRNRPQDFLPQNSFHDVDLGLLEIEYEQAGFRLQTIGAEKSAKYYKGWKPRRSLDYYRSLSELDPTNQEAQFDLAQVLSSLNQTRASISRYDRLLALDPCHTESRIAKRRLQLEQRPQLVNSFDYEFRSGRQGLTDITSLRIESVAVTPTGDADEYFIAGYAHRFLRPDQGEHADGNIGILGYQTKVMDYVNLFTIAELEQYNRGFSTRVPFRAGAIWRTPRDWRLGVAGFFENVAANGESIRQDTYRGGLELSAATFLTWRWQMDAMYRFASYSDDNSLNEVMGRSEYLLLPGRNQLRAKVDGSLFSFREQTQFANMPGDLFGTIHPYFSPSAFAFVTAGLEYQTWVSPHNFRGADEHWYSIYGGARVDSDSVGYGLVQIAGHRDYNGWLSAQINASAILSQVYKSVGIGGVLTVRFP